MNLIETAKSATEIRVDFDNYGGRKFVAFFLTESLLAGIFSVMLVFKWLDSGICLQFVTFVMGVYGAYMGANQLEKFIETKKQGATPDVK